MASAARASRTASASASVPIGLLHEADLLPDSYGGKLNPRALPVLLGSLPVIARALLRGKVTLQPNGGADPRRAGRSRRLLRPGSLDNGHLPDPAGPCFGADHDCRHAACGVRIFMTPLGWGWVAVVWGYAIAWFLITDRVKLLGYRILDPVSNSPAQDPSLPHRPRGSEAMRILVVNAGSSSVKLRIVEGDELISSRDLGAPDERTTDDLGDFVRDAGALDAVGHRVVHGGPRFTTAVVVDTEVREALDGLNGLAPLHNPPALAGIDAARRLLPALPQVACFDTAFHAGMPPAATTYAVPADWVSRWGIRRYGFHGLSCAWATRRAAEILGRPVDRLRLVVCHLGAGASVTAVAAGRSADTTMGFTPLEGLVMATRCGDLDPGALLHALGHGLSVADAEDALEHHSGLLGLSGGATSDMRRLLAARAGGDAQAGLAIEVYLHRLRGKIAAMTAATQGADALIFTGGVGERSPLIRAEACAGLDWLGVTLDAHANDAVTQADTEISAPGASVHTLVVHAREDLQIAHECGHLLGRDDFQH